MVGRANVGTGEHAHNWAVLLQNEIELQARLYGEPLTIELPEPPPEHIRRLLETLGAGWTVKPGKSRGSTSGCNRQNPLQMDASVQETTLPPDVVEDLESIIARLGDKLGADDGHFVLEAHFTNGRYAKAYGKRGPISREELRVLGGSLGVPPSG